MIPDDYVRLAESLAQTARETARRATADPEVDIKADGSPVTAMDRAVEAALRRIIERRQPTHGILGEELAPPPLPPKPSASAPSAPTTRSTTRPTTGP